MAVISPFIVLWRKTPTVLALANLILVRIVDRDALFVPEFLQVRIADGQFLGVPHEIRTYDSSSV